MKYSGIFFCGKIFGLIQKPAQQQQQQFSGLQLKVNIKYSKMLFVGKKQSSYLFTGKSSLASLPVQS